MELAVISNNSEQVSNEQEKKQQGSPRQRSNLSVTFKDTKVRHPDSFIKLFSSRFHRQIIPRIIEVHG